MNSTLYLFSDVILGDASSIEHEGDTLELIVEGHDIKYTRRLNDFEIGVDIDIDGCSFARNTPLAAFGGLEYIRKFWSNAIQQRFKMKEHVKDQSRVAMLAWIKEQAEVSREE